MTVNLKSKFIGSLVGTAVGDGLGASLEGAHLVEPDQVLALGAERLRLIYTDDTHMAIGVAESLLERKGLDGEHMARTFIRNFDAEPWRGYGPGPPRVFARIKAGEPWDKAAGRVYGGGSFGNGAAMRVAPVGLLYHDDRERLRQVAYGSSLVTHAHELGKEGAALQAYAVALACRTQPTTLDRQRFLDELEQFAVNRVYKEKLRKMGGLLAGQGQRPSASSGQRQGEPDRLKVVMALGNGIEAFNSVPAAIYSFLRYPDSFEEAVVYAISLGGDTDTIGAMCGAISGAYLGVEAIPELWRLKVENRAYLEGLGERLWQLKQAASAT